VNTVAILPGVAEYEDEEVATKNPPPTPPTLHSDPTCGPPVESADRQTDRQGGWL
jgi:hypothetical protein